jgi:hypothetical protein
MSYQTIKLSRGSHVSPEQGACVMELASMLAGDPFSDHPPSVCPVIGSFLRAYNDRVSDRRRQDLYRYAAEVVGSTAPIDVQQARAARLAEWGEEMWRRRIARRLLPGAWRLIGVEREPPIEVLGTYAVRAITRLTDQVHAHALGLIDELLAVGAGAGTSAAQATVVDAPSRTTPEGRAVITCDRRERLRPTARDVRQG